MKPLVLLSGGIDSAVALWDVKSRSPDAHAVTFHYHDRAPGEIEATHVLARAAGVPLRVVEMPWLREAGDLDDPGPLLADAPEGYVPARNLVFYSVAAHVAESLGLCTIVGGHHGEDAALFPDASPSFFERFEGLARLGVWSYRKRPLRVELPLRGLTKLEVIRRAIELDVPLPLTWSCYGTGERSCGRCRSCRERRDAFAALGREDPIAYAH